MDALKSLLRNLPFKITRNQWYDILTKRIIRRVCRPDSNCIDIGALNGDILSLMLRFAPDGKHYAFEPLPQYYTRLQERYGHRAAIFPCALGAAPGRSEFHFVTSNPSYSGFRKRRYDRAGETVEKIEVEVKTLDEVIPPEVHIDLIKIDVEGAELLVMKGGKRLINTSRPVIIFEHGTGGADVYGYGPEEVYAFLCTGSNMQIHTLGAWLRKEEPLSLEAFKKLFASGKEYYYVAHAGSFVFDQGR